MELLGSNLSKNQKLKNSNFGLGRRNHFFIQSTLAVVALICGSLLMTSCGNKNMAQKLVELENREATTNRRLSDLEGKINPMAQQVAQMKELMVQMANMVQDHDKSLKARSTPAAAPKSKPLAAVKKTPNKKPASVTKSSKKPAKGKTTAKKRHK